MWIFRSYSFLKCWWRRKFKKIRIIGFKMTWRIEKTNQINKRKLVIERRQIFERLIKKLWRNCWIIGSSSNGSSKSTLVCRKLCESWESFCSFCRLLFYSWNVENEFSSCLFCLRKIHGSHESLLRIIWKTFWKSSWVTSNCSCKFMC